MFSSYFDVIIMRSQIPDFAECCAYMMNGLEQEERRSVPIVNAGSGSDEHPTQALLDFYTIDRTFDFDQRTTGHSTRLAQLQQAYPGLERGPQNKTYAFCGDIGRGRTVRSLARVLSQYPGTRMVFVSPDHDVLRLDSALKDDLLRQGVAVEEVRSLDAPLDGRPLIEELDCLYMTRIQREHNSETTETELEQLDLEPFRLTPQRVSAMKSYAPILHPFPRDSVVGEIPPEIDSDPRVMYFRQARNGMWARAALLVHLFDAGDRLNAAANDMR
jgi:aspartate carbamoyltransferase catalytic subunit